MYIWIELKVDDQLESLLILLLALSLKCLIVNRRVNLLWV